jgi:hypothetical protein
LPRVTAPVVESVPWFKTAGKLFQSPYTRSKIPVSRAGKYLNKVNQNSSLELASFPHLHQPERKKSTYLAVDLAVHSQGF